MDVPCRWTPARSQEPGARSQDHKTGNRGARLKWRSSLGELAIESGEKTGLEWARQSVPELRGIELHECDRDSGAQADRDLNPERGEAGINQEAYA